MPTVLMTAPYMIPFLDRFRPVLADYGIDLIVPDVQERMEEDDILKYAGQFDGTICGDDRYTARVIEACAPRLKVIIPTTRSSGFPSCRRMLCKATWMRCAK